MGGGGSRILRTSHTDRRDGEAEEMASRARQAARAAGAVWDAAVARHPALGVLFEDHWRRAALRSGSTEGERRVLERYVQHCAKRTQKMQHSVSFKL